MADTWSDAEYHASQLRRLDPEAEFTRVKFRDTNDNETHYLRLTPEKLAAIAAILTESE